MHLLWGRWYAQLLTLIIMFIVAKGASRGVEAQPVNGNTIYPKKDVKSNPGKDYDWEGGLGQLLNHLHGVVYGAGNSGDAFSGRDSQGDFGASGELRAGGPEVGERNPYTAGVVNSLLMMTLDGYIQKDHSHRRLFKRLHEQVGWFGVKDLLAPFDFRHFIQL